MNAKEWLSRVCKIDQQIISKQEQIEKWRTLAESITNDPSAIPAGNGGKRTSKVEKNCIKIADAQLDIEKQIVKLVDIKREIAEAIDKMISYTYRILLEQRYLLCKSWEELAVFMGYTVRHITKNLHPAALRAVEYFIKKD